MEASVFEKADQRIHEFLRARSEEVKGELLESTWTEVRGALLGVGGTLVPGTDVNLLSRVIEAVGMLTECRRRIDTMTLVSAYSPMTRPNWMVEELYDEMIRRALWSRLEDLMEDRMRQELQKEKGITNDVWMFLGGWVRDLCDEILSVMSLPAGVRQPFRHALFETLFSICGYAAAGRADRVQQFRPLLEEMGRGFLLVGDMQGHANWVIVLDTHKPSQPVS